MQQSEASAAADVKAGGEAFRRVSEEYRADILKVRERNRKRRLRFLALVGLLVAAYYLQPLVLADPVRLLLPSFGPDAILWLFPLLIMVTVVGAVALPMLINGRSPHSRFSPEQLGTTFSDVRGIDIVLEEVTRTLQIFLTYKTFREKLGGNPRRGILFEGKPGTGKTHMAKAMATEAGVPFFFVSAPAFHSMFFGMTAFRIRSFFRSLKKTARKEGGAIGFIEEIDAVGSARGGVEQSVEFGRRSWINRFGSPDSGGGMVNELLIQLQSFDTPPFWMKLWNSLVEVANLLLPPGRSLRKRAAPYANILVIGATNRATSLDPALLRPGRFDRTLYFDLPSKVGRRDLIDYFLERRAHGSDMVREELREELAAMTLGYSPAALEHVFDEALVWAIRGGRDELTWRDVQRARLSEEIGIAQPVAYTERERVLIATHEAGHAVAAYLCAKDHRKLEVLSIIKRRQALGLLAHSDIEERYTKTKSELEATLKITLGGMAAEQLYFGEAGTGPSSDLHAATQLAAQMVGSFGMGSSLISYEAVNNGPYDASNIVSKVLGSEEAKREVEDLLHRHKDQVAYILENNRDLVEALRDALLEHEELLGDEIAGVLEDALDRREQKRR
ncbi:MAG: AAA family ATPase [Actinomycetota bacterium]